MSSPEIVKFLRDVADELEQGGLDDDEKKNVSESYLKYRFIVDLFKKLNESGEESGEDSSLEEEEDILKFLSMGWYIYTQIERGE